MNEIFIHNETEQENKFTFLKSIAFPFLFCLLLWIVKLYVYFFHIDISDLGIYPRKIDSLTGIVTCVFVHSSFEHITSNTLAIFILGMALFYFYRTIAYKVFFFSYLMTGLWVWAGARDAYHIGASGLVYALASFLFFSGIIRKYPRLMAISLAVVFLYGSLIWGIFPLIEEMSWESHLFGSIAGLILAFYYKKNGPLRPLYDWELEDDSEDSDNPEFLEDTKEETKNPFPN